ncbi:MAG: protein kinase domain-containing protein [Polyangiaceae bacterium]
MDPTAAGEVIAGKYRVEGVLGRGAMGVVIAARHIQLEQMVAIKLLARDAVGDEVAVERFLREAKAAARLRSDHVARVLDVGRLADGAPYMVMEHLEGGDLAQLLETHGRLEPAVACAYVAQACEAVAEAHARGIVHRDLKPENLYLTTRVGGGRMVKVLDFGVSKVMSGAQGALTQTRAVVGSPLYMAPEQLRSSKQASPRSDVWALGVVLYELLTQRWPFEAESLPDLCLQVSREPPRPIRELRADLPAGLAAVIGRCLEKDPAARYADAGALAVALEPFVEPGLGAMVAGIHAIGRSLLQTQTAPAVEAAPLRPLGRRTWIAACALVAAGVACVVGLGTSVGNRESAASEGAVVGALASPRLPRPTRAQPAPAAEPLVASGAAAASTGLPPLVPPATVLRSLRRVASPPPPARSARTIGSAAGDDIPAFR